MTLLLIAAYSLTVFLTYDRTKARYPHWQLRAELASMGAGIVMLILLTLLTYPHSPAHVPVEAFPQIVA